MECSACEFSVYVRKFGVDGSQPHMALTLQRAQGKTGYVRTRVTLVQSGVF